MIAQIEELSKAFLQEAEQAIPALLARAEALGGKESDLPGFMIGGDEQEFIFADVMLQGTRCKVGVERATRTINWVRLELIMDGINARHITFEMEDAHPEEVKSITAGDW